MRWALLLLVAVFARAADELHLTTDDAGYLMVIQGFATQLQCVLNTCSDKVVWYKDDILLFNGTTFQKSSGLDPASFFLNHKVDIDSSKGCTGECSTNAQCAPGHACIDNQCCACGKEDFSLVLRNLSFEDSGRYRCQISNESELLEFQVEVLESGLKGGFHQNISYDHSKCCETKGISTMCKAMCKPSDMGQFHFDPTSCKTDDYKNFLSCATDGGNRSHVHCCKTQMVPSFCYDFCSGDFQMLRRSHRLCLYYLPEIFECYNRAYLPYPDPPDDVMVNAVEEDKLSVCWKPPQPQPTNKDYPVKGYAVFYKYFPDLPFLPGYEELNSDLPFLTGQDYGDLTGVIDDDYDDSPLTTATAATVDPKRRKRSMEEIEKRHKRQSIRIMATDGKELYTSVREFSFERINTTETCLTIKDLRTASRYAVYVIAINDYGESVPSLRSITSTNVHVVSNEDKIPDSMQCCKDAKVESYCAEKMCNIRANSSVHSTFTLSTTCRFEWPKVSPCIADGRNHTECCRRKGVPAECLPICSGSTEELSAKSLLCVGLDTPAIYQCMREGYVTHPSTPVNVTVDHITTTSAMITWSEPAANAHLVESYTIFLRRNEHGAPIRQVLNATSPYTEQGLVPDSSYAVSVQSHSAKGTSLPSTTILFQTRAANMGVCPKGEPLMLSDGRPMLCHDKYNPCPAEFMCVEFLDDSYCCEADMETSNFHACCESRGLEGECLEACQFNATLLPDSCKSHLNTWVQCGSEGHDHSRCCEQRSLANECMPACRHPFEVPDSCIEQSPQLLQCYSSHHSKQPMPVQNPRISFISNSSALLEWNPAPNTDVYEVQWFASGVPLNRTNTTSSQYHIENLSGGSEYVARVITFNSVGSGAPSWNVTFKTLPEIDQEGYLPKAPLNVRLVWNKGGTVNVTWDRVKERRDGTPVRGEIEYEVYYIPASLEGSVRTYNDWALIRNGHDYLHLSVRVVAKEGDAESRESAYISFEPTEHLYTLPEPIITISPEKYAYDIGEKITVHCEARGNLTGVRVFMSAGMGNCYPECVVEVTSKLREMVCHATDEQDIRSTTHRIIRVNYGPEASMERAVVHPFVDHSAVIVCVVQGYPIPRVTFEKDGKHVGHGRGESVRFMIPDKRVDTYNYRLVLTNVTGRAGNYTCVAERNGKAVRQTAELITDVPHELPANPRGVIDCCTSHGLDQELLQTCSNGIIPANIKDINVRWSDAKTMMTCAVDKRDLTECCVGRGVIKGCLNICAGSESLPFKCEAEMPKIVSCYVRGHEHAPREPQNMNYHVVRDGKIHITWEDHDMSKDRNPFYAVYYKIKNSEDNFEIKNTSTQEIDLELDTSVAYDVGIMAGNDFGHSNVAFLQVEESSDDMPASTGGGTLTFLILLLGICSLIGFGVIVLGRRKALGGVFGSKPLTINDPTVAFENPGFNSEVEIRGLGTGNGRDADWQSAELQGVEITSSSADNNYRNGVTYSKLDG